MKGFIGVLYILLVVLSSSCGQTIPEDSKIRGLSFVASRDAVQHEHITPVVEVHANYAAIMPFGFLRDLEHPQIVYNTDRQWFGERKEGVKQYVEKLHEHNIEVMIKPQIWIWHGEFTGYLKMNSEADWEQLEDSYRQFILDFAEQAQELNVAMFCIGTELEQFIAHRPEFWKALIAEVRQKYHGKITYAANWDEYKRVPFWESLDYIGVDAYFPVSEAKTPTVLEAQAGWRPWKEELKAVALQFDKKIIFTEYGYRSTHFAGKEPWNSDHEIKDVNLEAQSNLMQGLYNEIWGEPWFAGGFLWKWFIDHEDVGGMQDAQFTPQNKPVTHVIKERYKAKD
ncbi:glycoside hydrolase family 113 [Altibacter lentus]|uniref:glycoside hydrolase family 113 n=1 Tax=Altibacter lentus TaxID=1223410 RepID=UPI0005505F2D|nr:glycoside hydrolase [Altibacter lentus]